MMTVRRWITLLTISVTVALGMLPFIVRAHADYERSDPAADAIVETAPTQLQVWFNQELFRREGSNRLEVLGPDGKQVDQGDTTVDDDDRTLLRVSLQPDLSPGTYQVRWHTLSADDGHEGDGEFVFHVGEPSAATATSVPAAEATPIPEPTATVAPTATPAAVAESTGIGVNCGAPALLLFFALGAVFMGQRRPRQV